METFKAILDYFTVTQWVMIGVGVKVFCWLGERLTDRYFERKAEKRKQELQRILSERRQSSQKNDTLP